MLRKYYFSKKNNKTLKNDERKSQYSQSGLNLLNLPDDVLLLILIQTEYASFTHLSAVNRKLYGIAKCQHPLLFNFWKKQNQFFFPHEMFKLNTITNADASKKTFIYLHKRHHFHINKDDRKKRLIRLVKEGHLELLEEEKLSATDLFNIVDDRDWNLIDWAARKKHQHLLIYFYQLCTKENSNVSDSSPMILLYPFHLAVCFNQVDIAKRLFLENFSKFINICPRFDKNSAEQLTPLNIAIRYGHEEIARWLIENGAVINCAHNNMGPIHFACKYGQLSLLKMLIEEFNANPDLGHKFKIGSQHYYRRALDYACAYDHAEVVQWLLNQNSVRDIREPTGWKNLFRPYYPSALNIAASNGHISIVKLLLTGRIPYSIEQLKNAASSTELVNIKDLINYKILKFQLMNHIKSIKAEVDATPEPENSNQISSLAAKQNSLIFAQILLHHLEERIPIDNLKAQCPKINEYDDASIYYERLRSLNLSNVWQILGDDSNELDLKKAHCMF